jgi:hypothetical protein
MPAFAIEYGFQSLFFVPIGRRQEKLGALFVCYHEHKNFGRVFTFTVLSLAQALAELMAELRYREIYSSGFGRPDFALHTLLDRYRHKYSSFRVMAEIQAAKNDRSADPAFMSTIDKADEAFRALELLTSAAPPGFWESSLSDELRRYKKGLIHNGSGSGILEEDIDPMLESESPWIRLVLYRIIVEATNNAIEHGKATEVLARARRAKRAIEAEITNAGLAPPLYDKTDHNPNGIYHLLEMCETQLGATTTKPTHHNGVTRVALSIPALPLVIPVTRPRHQPMEKEDGSL